MWYNYKTQCRKLSRPSVNTAGGRVGRNPRASFYKSELQIHRNRRGGIEEENHKISLVFESGNWVCSIGRSITTSNPSLIKRPELQARTISSGPSENITHARCTIAHEFLAQLKTKAISNPKECEGCDAFFFPERERET